jgi:hypothetical protein
MPDIPADVLVNAYEALDRAAKSPDMPVGVQFACAWSAGRLGVYVVPLITEVVVPHAE